MAFLRDVTQRQKSMQTFHDVMNFGQNPMAVTTHGYVNRKKETKTFKNWFQFQLLLEHTKWEHNLQTLVQLSTSTSSSSSASSSLFPRHSHKYYCFREEMFKKNVMRNNSDSLSCICAFSTIEMFHENLMISRFVCWSGRRITSCAKWYGFVYMCVYLHDGLSVRTIIASSL